MGLINGIRLLAHLRHETSEDVTLQGLNSNERIFRHQHLRLESCDGCTIPYKAIFQPEIVERTGHWQITMEGFHERWCLGSVQL